MIRFERFVTTGQSSDFATVMETNKARVSEWLEKNPNIDIISATESMSIASIQYGEKPCFHSYSILYREPTYRGGDKTC